MVGNKLLMILLLLLIFISGCGDRFNFTYNTEKETGEKTVYIKGNVDNNAVPNGEFYFYDINGLIDAKGNYVNGIKSGLWEYRFENKWSDIFWNKFENGKLKFPYLKKWQVMSHNGYIFSALQKVTKDSLIGELFRVREHNLMADGYSSFKDFDNAYRADLREMNKVNSTRELTHYVKESFEEVENVSFFQYVGIDKSENEFSAYFFLQQVEDTGKVLEFHYLTLNEHVEQKQRVIMDILVDAYYKDTLMLKKRWGVVN